jgi:serine/threonine protein phosphatase PrpC
LNLEAAGVCHFGFGRTQNQDRIVYDVERGRFAVIDGVGGSSDGGIAASILAKNIETSDTVVFDTVEMIKVFERVEVQMKKTLQGMQEMDRLDREIKRLADEILVEKKNWYRQSWTYRAFQRFGIVGMDSLDVIPTQVIEMPQRSMYLATVGTFVWIDQRVETFGKCLVGHIGDTRVYHLSEHAFVQITTDHNHVPADASEEERLHHPGRRLIYKCLTTNSKLDIIAERLEIAERELAVGEGLLLLSDGVTDYISPRDIRACVLSSWSAKPNFVAEKLLRYVLESQEQRNRGDNIAIVFVRRTS